MLFQKVSEQTLSNNVDQAIVYLNLLKGKSPEIDKTPSSRKQR